jgi:hypothetical protein
MLSPSSAIHPLKYTSAWFSGPPVSHRTGCDGRSQGSDPPVPGSAQRYLIGPLTR